MYLSRVAAMDAGVPETVPAMNVNRLCGSGAQAIVSVVQALQLGDADFGLAGGAESMSRAPYILPQARWGQKMGDAGAQDMMLGALNCPFGTGHMGVTAENVGRRSTASRREAQDAFALESQNRAAKAIAEGRFASQIVPVEIMVKRDKVAFDTDEHPKATSLEALAGLRTVFQKDGTVTAGNASGINDGAAAVVMARAEAAEAAGLKPRARIVGYAHAGVRPEVMGIGPIPAVEKLLERTGLSADGLRRHRIERGLRRAGARGDEGPRPRPGPGEPERRRHRARSPGRRDRRDPHRQGAPRARAHRRPLRPGHHVHRRRAGNRHRARKGLKGFSLSLPTPPSLRPGSLWRSGGMSYHESSLTVERRARLAAERLFERRQAELAQANQKIAAHARLLTDQFTVKREEAEALRRESHTVRHDLERAQSAVQIAERRLWDSVETIRDGFAVFDPDGTLVAANSRLPRPLRRHRPGRPRHQLPGTSGDRSRARG